MSMVTVLRSPVTRHVGLRTPAWLLGQSRVLRREPTPGQKWIQSALLTPAGPAGSDF